MVLRICALILEFKKDNEDSNKNIDHKGQERSEAESIPDIKEAKISVACAVWLVQQERAGRERLRPRRRKRDETTCIGRPA